MRVCSFCCMLGLEKAGILLYTVKFKGGGRENVACSFYKSFAQV